MAKFRPLHDPADRIVRPDRSAKGAGETNRGRGEDSGGGQRRPKKTSLKAKVSPSFA